MTAEANTTTVCGKCAATLADAAALERHNAWHDQQDAPPPEVFHSSTGHSYELRGGQLVRVGAPPRNLPADLQRWLDQPAWTVATDEHGRPIVDEQGALVTRPVI